MLFAVFAATGSDVSAPPATTVLAVIGAAVAGIVLWILGAKLLRGRPRTVLFLRRFGFDQAKDFISHAAAQALGRRWRLVTLDDLATTPVGTRPWKRWA